MVRITNIILLASLWVSGLVCLIFFSVLPARSAAVEASLHFNPVSTDISSGRSTTITVQIDTVENLYGLELDILFDPTVVMVEKIAPGNFLSADFVAEQKIDNQTGRASLAYTQIAKDAKSGNGTIVVLVVRKTNCLGTSPLKLMDVILSNQNGESIPYAPLAAGSVSSGTADANSGVRGTIFHDIDQNGSKNANEPGLIHWPVFVQRLNITPVGLKQMGVSTETGLFQLDQLSCGRYQLWSQNGETRVLTQTLDLSPNTTVNSISLPITGTLDYPLLPLYLPSLSVQ